MSLIKRPGSPVWYCQARHHGKILRRSTGTTDQALAQAYHDAQWTNYLRLLDAPPEDSRTVQASIIREVAREAEEVGDGEAWRVDIALDLWERYCAAAGILTIDDITTDHLEDYRRRRLSGALRSPKTKRAKDGIGAKTLQYETNAIMRLCRLNHHPLDPPRRLAARRTYHRSFAPDELRRFFQNCAPHHLTFFLTLYATGARVAELQPSPRSRHVPLLLSEVDPAAGRITIRSAKQRLGAPVQARTLAVDPALCARILAEAPVPGQYAFARWGEYACIVFDRTLARAEIPKLDPLGRKLTAHSLRHTRATTLLEQTGDVDLVQQVLGHTNLRTTQIYLHRQSAAPAVDLTPYLKEGTTQ